MRRTLSVEGCEGCGDIRSLKRGLEPLARLNFPIKKPKQANLMQILYASNKRMGTKVRIHNTSFFCEIS
jgi:hypothetical protein